MLLCFILSNPGKIKVRDDTIGSKQNAEEMIEAEGLTLTVPPESFSSPVHIGIFSGVDSMNAFGDNTFSEIYRIEGLPVDFTKPIEVAIKYSGSLANENYLAVGREMDVIEFEEPSFHAALFEARDSSGYLVSSIEPPSTDLSDAVVK